MKKSIFYILLTAVLFTTLEPISKLIAAGIHPITITFWRFFVGGLILLPFSIMKVQKIGLKLVFKDYMKMALLGILCVCVSMPLLQYGVKLGANPALIAIIFSSNSVFTVVLAAIALKERITVRKLIAVMLCLAGVLVCFEFKSGTNLLSVVLAVAASISFSIYTVISKKLTSRLSGIIQTGFSFLFGSIVLLAVLLFTRTGFVAVINQQNIFILLYLGIGVTGVGYWSYFAAMEKGSAMEASLVFFIKPVLTPFFAFFITSAPLTVRTFTALMLILAGSVMATHKHIKKQEEV